MIDYNNVAFNRFTNLDSIEDRIIYYLLSPNNKKPQELEQTHIIWKLLMYKDLEALNKPTPKYQDVVKLIANDNISQTDKRIFRDLHLEDGWIEQCSLLKIYIDQVIPQNRAMANVLVGIDIITHNKITNVRVPQDDKTTWIDEVDGMPVRIETKNRTSVLMKAVLSLLNGAEVAGVGQLVFDPKLSRFIKAESGLWNNRNFGGVKIVMGTLMSGVE